MNFSSKNNSIHAPSTNSFEINSSPVPSTSKTKTFQEKSDFDDDNDNAGYRPNLHNSLQEVFARISSKGKRDKKKLSTELI